MDRPISLSFQAVEDWLRNLGLLHYAQSFYDNGYEDIETVKQIGVQDLNAIDIKSERDRNDILRGVNSLRQNLYFELETGSSEAKVERVKLEPILLKTKVKECLQKHNVQLTEPPYFNPDGTLGDLYPLAIRFSDELETIFDDVLQALENLRKRQLPVKTYDAMTEGVDDEIQKERSLTVVNPADYLDCETPGKKRSFSFSKHDTRTTKSTTDLTKVVNKDEPLAHRKIADKPKSLFGSVFRKKPESSGKSMKGDHQRDHQRLSSCDFNATDVNLSQNEIIDMFAKVKNNQISQEDALAAVKKACQDKERRSSQSPHSSPDLQRKFSKDGSLGRSKKNKIEKSQITRTPSSHFYTKEDGKDHDSLSLNDYKADSRKNSLLDPDALPGSTKSSPDTSKHGFLRGIRNSLRKKGKLDEDKLEKSPSGSTSSHESLRSADHSFDGDSQPTYVDLLKTRSPSTRSADEDISYHQKPRRSLSSSFSGSDIHELRNDEYNFNRQSSLKIKSYEKYQDQVSTRQNQNITKVSSASTDKSEAEKKDFPKPPPRVFKGNKIVLTEATQPPLLPLRPINQRAGSVRPAIPPRKDLTSPDEEKNIDQIGQEVNQLIAGLNSELLNLKNPALPRNNDMTRNQANRLPIMPPKRTMKPIIPKTKLQTTDSLINDLKNTVIPTDEEQTKFDSNMNFNTPLVAANKPPVLVNKPSVLVNKPLIVVNKKDKYKKLSLHDLVVKKLDRENIDLHKAPYTKHDGVWNIPLALTKRYSLELHTSNIEIENAFDDIRGNLCLINDLSYIEINVKRETNDVRYIGTTLSDWLLFNGLPMFVEDLKVAEVTTLDELNQLEADDFLHIGIYDEKHVKLLLHTLDKYLTNKSH